MVIASPLRYDLEPVKRQQCVQLLREIHPHVQRSRLDSDAGLFSRRHGVQDLRIRLIVGAPQNTHGSLSTRAIELGNHLRFIWNLQQYLGLGTNTSITRRSLGARWLSHIPGMIAICCGNADDTDCWTVLRSVRIFRTSRRIACWRKPRICSDVAQQTSPVRRTASRLNVDTCNSKTGLNQGHPDLARSTS